MRQRGERSALELGRLPVDMTAGQRYTAVLVAVITATVLATGLPDGKVTGGTGLGDIPVLAGDQRARRATPSSTVPVLPVVQLVTATTPDPPSAVAPPESAASPNAASEEPATTTTTQPPSASGSSLPVDPPVTLPGAPPVP